MTGQDNKSATAIVGQRYAYATASLLLGISCFTNFVGLEKAILAIIFGWLALKREPAPVLMERRNWAKTGLVLGSIILLVMPTLILLNLDRVKEFIEALEKLSNGR